MKIDNGHPFQGSEFKDFANNVGFAHRRITPLWPKANGEAERCMRTIGKAIRAAHVEGLNWKQEMSKCLRINLLQPNVVQQKYPYKTSIVTDKTTKSDWHSSTRWGIKYQNESLRWQGSARFKSLSMRSCTCPKESREQIIYTVHSNSLWGTQITAKRGEHLITRNSPSFKKVEGERGPITINESEPDVLDPTSDHKDP